MVNFAVRAANYESPVTHLSRVVVFEWWLPDSGVAKRPDEYDLEIDGIANHYDLGSRDSVSRFEK